MRHWFSIRSEIAKRNPYFPICRSELIKKIQEPPPNWMEERIEKDLGHHKKFNTVKTLENVKKANLEKRAQLHRLVIRENRLILPHLIPSLKPPRLRKMVFFLRQIVRALPIPNVDFLFSLHDLYEEKNLLDCAESPIFLISKTESNKQTALFPHVEWLNQWNFVQKQIKKRSIRWNERREQLLWRGSTTGEKVRWAISELGAKYPLEIDAGFCYLAQSETLKGLELKKSLRIEEQIRYKYLLALDGNCFPGSFFWQLFSESLIFKQQSPYLEWYYGGLKPNVHYLSISPDGSDLLEKRRWAQEHDFEAKKMGQNGKAFAEHYLTIEGIIAYTYHLLKRYSAMS